MVEAARHTRDRGVLGGGGRAPLRALRVLDMVGHAGRLPWACRTRGSSCLLGELDSQCVGGALKTARHSIWSGCLDVGCCGARTDTWGKQVSPAL